ncbi:hypothetical protein JXA84_01245 [candidate division WOR-3 bacterium]|nr:hypothetical protein [candidate division WOR-3 bacterium]
MNVIDQLYELHKLDERISKLKKRTEAIPERLSKLEENYKKREAEIHREKEALKLYEVEKKKIEIDIESHETKINTFKLQQQKVKTNEEYTSLGSQIEFSKNKISELETKEIELFDEMDRMKNELSELENRHSSEKNKFENEKMNLLEEEKRGKKIIEELVSQRESFVPGLEQKAYKKYEKIRNARETAMALIFLSDLGSSNSKKNFWICEGCNSMVSPHLVEEVKKKTEIAYCESCGRILYFVES